MTREFPITCGIGTLNTVLKNACLGVSPLKEIAKYFYELGHLKHVQRAGWWRAGVRDPESVAEHSFRTAIVAYILAQLEGADPCKALVMAVLHDAPEARVNDMTKLAKRYVEWSGVERRALADQVSRLPPQIAKRISELFDELDASSTLEARIVHDADKLECLLQAREYMAQGYIDADKWVESSRAALVTACAKELADLCIATEPAEWWTS